MRGRRGGAGCQSKTKYPEASYTIRKIIPIDTDHPGAVCGQASSGHMVGKLLGGDGLGLGCEAWAWAWAGYGYGNYQKTDDVDLRRDERFGC